MRSCAAAPYRGVGKRGGEKDTRKEVHPSSAAGVQPSCALGRPGLVQIRPVLPLGMSKGSATHPPIDIITTVYPCSSSPRQDNQEAQAPSLTDAWATRLRSGPTCHRQERHPPMHAHPPAASCSAWVSRFFSFSCIRLTRALIHYDF